MAATRPGSVVVDLADEIVAGCCVAHAGEVRTRHPPATCSRCPLWTERCVSLTTDVHATESVTMRTSMRTVGRRVERILARLDAATRFQAGAQAARRNWL